MGTAGFHCYHWVVSARDYNAAWAWLVVALALLLAGCRKPYRVGEYVWVEWEEGRDYPAYIVERRGKRRFRVHFEGYDARCDETVVLDRIKGRVEGTVIHPPPPTEGPCRQTASAQASGSAVPVSPYRVGDRVRVRWRGSTYSATIVGVVDADRYLIHYDGHENAFDETVTLDRVVSRR